MSFSKVGDFVSFKLETTEIDLGDTPIENIFINDFMPMANGTYVKVYLLGYKYAYDRDLDIEVNNETIAKHLEIPLGDVLKAWEFWEEKGIVKRIPKNDKDKYDYKVKFLNLKQLYINNNYEHITLTKEPASEKRPKYHNCSTKEVIEANTSPLVQKMFRDVEYILGRPLFPNEKQRIVEWLYNYNLNPELIVKAFFYSMEIKGSKNVNTVEKVIRSWYNKGILNVEALMEHLKKKDERIYSYERIMKSLGFIGRNISEGERKVVDKWFDEYNFSLEMILKACENTKKTSNPSINYINGILSSWHSKGIKTVDEIEEKDKRVKTNNKNNKGRTRTYYKNLNRPKTAQTRFHNFEQRTSQYSSDELEEIARKKREEYYFKIKGD